VLALINGSSAIALSRDPLLGWEPTIRNVKYPRDYFVPHFGEDHEISNTKENLNLAEDMLKHKWNPVLTPPPPPPTNYFVPQFGRDSDIVDTLASVRGEETRQSHDWDPVAKMAAAQDPPPRNYFVPDFGVDKDINDSTKSLSLMEKKMGTWNFPPPGAHPNGGPDHPINYVVPNFGEDQDIIGTKASVAQQEALHGKWVPE